ncbi:MAG TPA: hypothetical protein VMH80_19240 [Bryobacteraceae bacterium]|nr:hypothetical protein [Bryobacteraceae bacterium]
MRVFLLALVAPLVWGQNIITTVAGSGDMNYSGDGGPAISAGLNPQGVAIDSAGNLLIADIVNNRVRQVTPDGKITTVAGCGGISVQCVLAGLGDGGPALAPIINVFDVAADKLGNYYIADDGNNRVRIVNSQGIMNTVAGNSHTGFSGDGGQATNATLNGPLGMAIDSAGNVYFADVSNNRVRKVSASGIITTIAGNGTQGFSGDEGLAVNAELYSPHCVAVDSAGNVYFSDTSNNRIRKIDTSGMITTVAGNGGVGSTGDGGPATAATLSAPWGVAVDGAGNLYIADWLSHKIRKVDTKGIITTIAGNGTLGFSGDNGPATSAELNAPTQLTFDNAGNLYIADTNNRRVRKVTGVGTFSQSGPKPVVTAALNAATFAKDQPLVQGSLASIFGTNLAPSTVVASAVPLPFALHGVSVTIAGVAAPLLFVSSGQINLQIPWTLQTGSSDIVVTLNGSVSAAFSAMVGGLAPGIFTTNYGTGPAIAINPDGSLAQPVGSISGIVTHPAKVGDTIILLGTGLGITKPSVPAAGAASSDQLRTAIIQPTVTIGGVPATVSFAGLSPQFVGVNQLNVVVPNVSAGVVPIQIDSLQHLSSDNVTIAVASQ